MVRHIGPRVRVNYDDVLTTDEIPLGTVRRGYISRRRSLTKTGKCDHERTRVDEDGIRCLYCAAWIEKK